MIRRIAILMVFGMMVAHTQVADAQFAKFRKPAAGADSGADLAALVTSFAGSQQAVISAQIEFAEAFGLQDQATLLQAEQKALSSGQVDTRTLKKVRKVSDEASRLIEKKLTETSALTGASKKNFTAGIVHYGKALVLAAATVDSAQAAGNSIAGNPLTMSAEAKTAVYVARATPGYFKNLQKSTKMIFDYARRNDIEPPSDATALLAGL